MFTKFPSSSRIRDSCITFSTSPRWSPKYIRKFSLASAISLGVKSSTSNSSSDERRFLKFSMYASIFPGSLTYASKLSINLSSYVSCKFNLVKSARFFKFISLEYPNRSKFLVKVSITSAYG